MHERLDRGDIDDAPLGGPQGLEKRMRHIEDAIKIDRDDVFPILDDGRRSASHAVAAGEVRIVYPDRDPAHPCGNFLCPRYALFPACPIARQTFRPAARLANLLRPPAL